MKFLPMAFFLLVQIEFSLQALGRHHLQVDDNNDVQEETPFMQSRKKKNKASASCCQSYIKCKKLSGICTKPANCKGVLGTTKGCSSGCQCCLPAPSCATTAPCPTCPSTCPSGYTMVESQCLAFRTDKEVSWDCAQVYCQKTGGRLVKPKDQDKLATYIKANHAGKNFWLGASDVHTEGEWLWLSGGVVDSSIWYNGEPNNAGAGGEDCMLWWGADVTGYIDEGCSESRYFICEADME